MLNEISWTQYIIGVLLMTILYYSYIIYHYHSGGKLNIWNLNKDRDLVVEDQKMEFTNDTPQPNQATSDPAASENQIEEVDAFIAAIQKAFSTRQTLNTKSVEELLLNLFTSFSNIKQSPHRSSLNEFIQSEGEKYGHAMPSEIEINLLWEGKA